MISRLRAVLLLFVVVSFVSLIHPARTKTQTAFFGYCMSDPGSSPVYISNVFDFGSIADSNPIQNEFNEYLRGRFEYRTNSSFGAQCPGTISTMEEASARKRAYENQLRQGNKQIVEIEWTYTPNPLLSSPPGQHRATASGPSLVADNTFCISETYSNTIYVARPVQTGPSVSLANWNSGFMQYLKQRYSFPGKVNCNTGPKTTAERLVSAHVQGARAAGKNVVDTNWRLTSNTASTAQQQDEDREPVAARPSVVPQVSQSELQQARAGAQREMPVAADFCRKDPALSKVFSCANFSQQVVAYRVAHRADAGAKEPLERLVDDAKFPCQGCIDGTQVLIWVRRRILAEKINPKSQSCVVSTLTKTLNSNTSQVRRRLEEFYQSAVAQCNP